MLPNRIIYFYLFHILLFLPLGRSEWMSFYEYSPLLKREDLIYPKMYRKDIARTWLLINAAEGCEIF